jgi:hypothetical protein
MPFEKVHTIRDIPDRIRCVIGIKEIGLVEYRFQPDSFEVRHVRAPGQIDVGLNSPFDSDDRAGRGFSSNGPTLLEPSGSRFRRQSAYHHCRSTMPKEV